jgi:hypothetical protein
LPNNWRKDDLFSVLPVQRLDQSEMHKTRVNDRRGTMEYRSNRLKERNQEFSRFENINLPSFHHSIMPGEDK